MRSSFWTSSRSLRMSGTTRGGSGLAQLDRSAIVTSVITTRLVFAPRFAAASCVGFLSSLIGVLLLQHLDGLFHRLHRRLRPLTGGLGLGDLCIDLGLVGQATRRRVAL